MTTYIIILLVIFMLICILYIYTTSQDGFEGPAINKSSLGNYSDINIISKITNTSFNDNQSATSSSTIDPTSDNWQITQTPIRNAPDMSLQEKYAECEKEPMSCNAFNNPNSFFSNNCGISFDNDGTDSKGQVHMGGMFVSQDDKITQLEEAKNVDDNDKPPYDSMLIYQPSVGSSKKGKFVLTKDTCIVLKERLDCESKKNIGVDNCSQCYTNQNFIRVGPETGKEKSTLYIYAKGTTLTISSLNNKIVLNEIKINGEITQQVDIPEDSEGTNFNIRVTGKNSIVAGYISGSTPNGDFNIDLVRLIKSDTVTGGRPKLNRTKTVNNIKCTAIIPGNKQLSMNLSCIMPFTFLDSYHKSSMYCNNGPVSTKLESVTFLESDPCYSKGNAAGNYKLECLQSRFVSLGGLQEGTGYPSTQQLADAIQKDERGNPLDIYTITNNLSNTINRAITGKDEYQNKLSISDWNKASLFALNKPIDTPCDSFDSDTGAVSQDCLIYLYNNEGETSHIGPTYIGKDNTRSLFNNNNNTYCISSGTMNPENQNGVDMVQGKTLDEVKKFYDTTHTIANNNEISNKDREDAIKKCYGITLNKNTNKLEKIKQVFYDNGTVSCDTYCKGLNGNSWNNEMPEFNGAEGASGFLKNGKDWNINGPSCMCKETGKGWNPRGGESVPEWYPTGPKDEIQRVYGNNGSVSCDTYCGGIGGGPWNNELPYNWNGARGVGGFIPGGTNCICKKTGQGWN